MLREGVMVSEEEELMVALAVSRAEEAARRSAQEAHDWALAVAEQERVACEATAAWSCSRCLLENPASMGRCEACLGDRFAPHIRAEVSGGRSVCSLPGCRAAAGRDGFCGPDHARRAASRGLLAPASDDEERCFAGPNYSVALLTKKSAARSGVVARFGAAWRKGAPPTVKHVYRVVPPLELRTRFERHAAAVGNLRLRYHGTSSTCGFATDLSRSPCEDDACALCSILRLGFRIDRAGTGPNSALRALRYGRGIYLSATSGKANDYAARSERLRPWKAGATERWRVLLVCAVAAGRAFCTTAAQLPAGPPPGFDSLVGEVGDNLNYDEIVLYDEAAVLPQFLVIYALPP
mmetsp:Transcript_1163/g.3490  ORF Transcript_1163/g.3490 Transcript_1163/m.3490 type:complete len:351 (-) Transcript_1163:146-1198(-)